MDDLLRWILTLALLEAGLALVLVLGARARAAALVGATRGVQRGPRALASVLLVVLLALAAAALIAPEPQRGPVLALLGLSALVAWAQPVGLDGALGERGVRHGWRVRRLADLEEWRLTGDHLRVRLAGEWVAVRLPRERHAEARALLEAGCGARESRFRT